MDFTKKTYSYSQPGYFKLVANHGEKIFYLLAIIGFIYTYQDFKGQFLIDVVLLISGLLFLLLIIGKILIDEGADINAGTNGLRTPLHSAAIWGNRDNVELLLINGAEINVQDGRSRTPLSWAKERGHTEIVELLTKHGAKDDTAAPEEPKLAK